MKTIQIPTNSNPFIVNINNNVYQYKAGETAEVPDEVAAAIEDALNLVPKPKRYLSKMAQLADGSITEIKESDLSGIDSVVDYAFYKCINLMSVTIPEGVNRIGEFAFSSCPILRSVIIPNSVTSIGTSAFHTCTALEGVIIPGSVTSIDDSAFKKCIGLKRVIVKALTPPDIQGETFFNVPATCSFEVPLESVEAYKTAENWSSIASQIIAIKE